MQADWLPPVGLNGVSVHLLARFGRVFHPGSQLSLVLLNKGATQAVEGSRESVHNPVYDTASLISALEIVRMAKEVAAVHKKVVGSCGK